MERKIPILMLLSGFVVWINILFHWPLREYFDYMTYISFVWFIRKYGLYGISHNWANGFSVWFNNAPLFPLLASIIPLPARESTILLLFAYLFVFWWVLKKIIPNATEIILFTLGSGLAYKWFFKTGRIPEMGAQFATWILIFYLIKKGPEKKIIATTLLISLLHHPLMTLFPLLFILDFYLKEKKSRQEILKGLGLFVLIGVFYLIPFIWTNNTAIHLVKKTTLLGKHSFTRIIELFLGYLSVFILLDKRIFKKHPIYFSFLIFTGADIFFSTMFSIRLFWFLPFIKSMYELTPLIHYLPLLIYYQKSTFKKRLFVYAQFLFFLGREILFIQSQGVPDFLINPEKNIEDLNYALSQIHGKFDYFSKLREFPTELAVSGYAAIEFNLSTYRSGSPEILSSSARKLIDDIRQSLNKKDCERVKALEKKEQTDFLLTAGYGCPGRKFGNFTLIKTT